MATTLAPDRRRTSRAASWSALVVSGHLNESGAGPAVPASDRAGVSVTTAPAAPAARRGGDKVVPVESIAAYGDEQIPGGRSTACRSTTVPLSGPAVRTPPGRRSRRQSRRR
jgi:hypothetical protein